MKPEALALGVAGLFGGLLIGWIIGAQYTGRPMAPLPTPAPASTSAGTMAAPEPGPVDEARAASLRAEAEARPEDAAVRAELGNVYFDAARYNEAITWYEAALAVDPRDADISTDLAVSYYYTDQADRALQQFAHSLDVDPDHTKTLLNLGIVRAFAKRDLPGAVDVWERVIALAPDSPEGRAARQALDAVQSVHAGTGS